MPPAGCLNNGKAMHSVRAASAARGWASTRAKVKVLFAIEKGHDGSVDKVRVTFSVPAIDGCESLYLVGWFDEWKESTFPMARREDGGWELTLELDRGCDYLYRFRAEDGTWLRDPSMPAGSAAFGLNTSFYLSKAVKDQDTP
jgi:1,4-alpha-glucan branching enzyme